MTAQDEFNQKYISSTEMCQKLGVTRATLVNGRRRGMLPEPIRINRPNGDPHVMLWVRTEVAPYMDRWSQELSKASKVSKDINASLVMTNYHAQKNASA